MSVEIRTAAEILAPEPASEWEARRAQRDDPLLRAIWREFVETGGPVALETASRRMAGIALATARARAAELDAADLIALDGDRVELAYPFTARPNDFAVVLPGGRLRYACCAIDALGVAPMIATPVRLQIALPPERRTARLRRRSRRRPARRAAGEPRVGRAEPVGRRPALRVLLNASQLLPVGRGAPGVAQGDARRRRGGADPRARPSSSDGASSEACWIRRRPSARATATGRASPPLARVIIGWGHDGRELRPGREHGVAGRASGRSHAPRPGRDVVPAASPARRARGVPRGPHPRGRLLRHRRDRRPRSGASPHAARRGALRRGGGRPRRRGRRPDRGVRGQVPGRLRARLVDLPRVRARSRGRAGRRPPEVAGGGTAHRDGRSAARRLGSSRRASIPSW